MKSARRRQGDPKIAVAYVRVSTEDQNLGPDAQRASIERWAAVNGVHVVEMFEDRLSGGTAIEDRPGFMAALDATKRHGAGLIVAAKRDRLAREVVIAATIERLAQDAGARVATADGVTIEDTPEGNLMRGLLDLFAQYERAVIRARTRAALAAKRAKGERVSRRPPIGYRFENGRLVEDPEEQHSLQAARAMRADGLSYQQIVDRLNDAGVKCRGARWHLTTLLRVFTRERKAAA